MNRHRSKTGRYSCRIPTQYHKKSIRSDHDCYGNTGNVNIVTSNADERWKIGRRLVEWDVLLSNLKFCKKCGLGPVSLTHESIQGELQKGLGGYLYVKCSYNDCGFVNRAAYGKTYHEPSTKGHSGMPCFAVNTKLGTGTVILIFLAFYCNMNTAPVSK